MKEKKFGGKKMQTFKMEWQNNCSPINIIKAKQQQTNERRKKLDWIRKQINSCII